MNLDGGNGRGRTGRLAVTDDRSTQKRATDAHGFYWQHGVNKSLLAAPAYVKGCGMPALIRRGNGIRKRWRAGVAQASGEETAEWTDAVEQTNGLWGFDGSSCVEHGRTGLESSGDGARIRGWPRRYAECEGGVGT